MSDVQESGQLGRVLVKSENVGLAWEFPCLKIMIKTMLHDEDEWCLSKLNESIIQLEESHVTSAKINFMQTMQIRSGLPALELSSSVKFAKQ